MVWSSQVTSNANPRALIDKVSIVSNAILYDVDRIADDDTVESKKKTMKKER